MTAGDVEAVLTEASKKLGASSPLWVPVAERAKNPWRRPAPPPPCVLHVPGPAAALLQAEQLSSVVRVLPELDAALLPPGAPLAAWLVQGFYPLVRAFCRPQGESTIRDCWTRTFRGAAMVWGPINPNRGVFERMNEEEERLAHLMNLQWDWWQFCDQIQAHKAPEVLPPECVVLLPVLNMPRNRTGELNTAIKVLAHPKIVWLVSEEE